MATPSDDAGRTALVHLVIAGALPPLTFGWGAGFGRIVLLFAALGIWFAWLVRVERAPYRGWLAAVPWVLAFWLLPSSLPIWMSARGFRRASRARVGSRLHRSDVRAILRPIVPYVAAVGWLASRPPLAPDDRMKAHLLVWGALLVGLVLVARDVVDLLETRAARRRAEAALPVAGAAHDGLVACDFGVGDERRELVDERGGYRDAAWTGELFRGDARGAHALLARSTAWSAATALVALGLVLFTAR